MKNLKINEVISLLEDELSWNSAIVKETEKPNTLMLECMPGSSIKKDIQKVLMDALIPSKVSSLKNLRGEDTHYYYILLN
jgi:hypothetical protein